MSYRMVTWPMTSRDLERSNSWPQYAYSAISRKLRELDTSNLVCSFVSGMPRGRTNNFPWKWAWPTSRGPTIFGIRSNISPKLLELETSNLVGGFVWRASSRTNNFPGSGRGLGHVTATIFGSTVGYPSDSLASCLVWNYTTTWQMDRHCQTERQTDRRTGRFLRLDDSRVDAQ